MGAAGVGIAIFMALSLAVSWISGDKARGSLEDRLDDEIEAQQRLERELKDAKVKAANDGQLLRDLENKLNAEIAEKKRLERQLDIIEAQQRIAEQEGGSQKASGTDQQAISELEKKNKEEIAMLEARLKAAEEARKQAEKSLTELEDYRDRYDKLSKQYADKAAAAEAVSLEELQRKNAELKEKLRLAEQARISIEDRLAGYENAFTLARASIRSDKLVLEDEKLNAKLTSLRTAIDNATASGALKEDPSKPSLAASMKEAELLLEQARARRAEAEAVLNNSANKDLALLIKDLGTMYTEAKKEKEEALLTVGLLQATAKQRSKGQVSSLESRLMSLEHNRRGMEGQLTDAMAAIVALDETAARLEAGLGASGEQSEGMLKLQNEIESLRRAREDVKLAMENVKGSMQSNMDSETLRMKSEINQLSGSLEQIALINKGVGATSLMGQAGLQEEPLDIKGGDDTAILNKKLQGLNLTIEGVFQEAPTAQVIQPVAVQQGEDQSKSDELRKAQARLLTAEAKLLTAQAELETAKSELQATQAQLQTTEAEKEAVQAKLQAAQARLEAAQAELSTAQVGLQMAQVQLQAIKPAAASPCAEVSEDRQLYESYIVKRGDSLWKIAAKKKIYGNPYLWPVLYKYNIETIYNPDIIQPDFALKIKKGPEGSEKELAVKKARRHNRDRRKKGYIRRLRRELKATAK